MRSYTIYFNGKSHYTLQVVCFFYICISQMTDMKFIYFFFVFLLFSCSEDEEQVSKHFHLVCGAEEVSGDQFQAGDEYLANANCRSLDYPRSGRYSFKLNKKHQFGPSYKLKSIKKGDIIYASVYRKKGNTEGRLIVASKGDVQYQKGELYYESYGDWELLKCTFVARSNYDFVGVYLWNPSNENAYFDDMTIDCFRDIKKPTAISEDDILRIDIPSSAMDSIKEFRDKALKQKVISSELKTYFNASVIVDGKKVPASLRLKGDWTDHLEGNKWSYRIKLKGSNSYHGMKKFSIQDGYTRSFMKEWFAHRIFETEDILTTRYQFKVVYINGENKGVYALEEHFDKRLLENRKRREGPIVKFDESGIWQARIHGNEQKEDFKNYPYLESAEILPFSKKRTRKSPILLGQFKLAQSHMDRYRNFDQNLHEYLDMDKMARYLAICEVMNATHGLIWHNQRNYLNPVKGCLEPIAYDCFSGKLFIHTELMGMAARWRSDEKFTILDGLFLNEEFDQLYIKYLKKYSDETYLKDRFTEFEKEMKYYESLLKHEYPMYEFNRSYFEINRINVEQKVKDYEKLEPTNRTIQKTNVYGDEKVDVVFDEAALKVYTVFSDSSSCSLQFENYALTDIEIIGYSTKQNKKFILPFKQSWKMGTYEDQAQKRTKYFDFLPRNIFYKTSVTGDSLLKTKVSSFPPNKFVNVLGSGAKPFSNSNDSIIVLEKGIYTFNSTVYFPRNKKLIIKEGVRINLRSNARFVSYSPIEMRGSKDNPIEFFTTDEKAGGLVILPEGKQVVLEHVNFSRLTAGNNENWVLTGAVTVYEGKVKISNCTFRYNKSEDALNLIRCEFKMNNCVISETQSDGFDADFCTGSITNCQFNNTGNDCIDFSGSQISIESCTINGSGDKGISGGESSILKVLNCDIKNASIAVASKDNSKITVENTSISNSSYAFAAYQKKSEFGPSMLNVITTRLKNVSNDKLIELDSKINIDGNQYVGKEVFDIDSMYSVFTKSL